MTVFLLLTFRNIAYLFLSRELILLLTFFDIKRLDSFLWSLLDDIKKDMNIRSTSVRPNMDHQSKKEIKIRSSTYLDKKKRYESQMATASRASSQHRIPKLK